MGAELPDDATVRDRMNSRLDVQPCGGCHMQMDTIGIGMEDIDQFGNFRTVYDDGSAVDSAGEVMVSNLPEPAFDGTVDLAHKLAESESYQRCAAEQWLRFASGRESLEGSHFCSVQRLHEATSSGGLRELMVAVVTSDAFRFRTEEAP